MENPRAPRDPKCSEKRTTRSDDDDRPSPHWSRLAIPLAGAAAFWIWAPTGEGPSSDALATDKTSRLSSAAGTSMPAADDFAGKSLSPAPPIPGRWTVQQSVDPLTDKRRVVAILPAERPASGVRLIAACTDLTTVTIDWGDYLGSDSRHIHTKHVTTRIGQETAETTRWDIANTERATFKWDGEQLLKSLLGHDRYVAKVTPYQSGPVTAVFDLMGIREAITPLAEACDWLLDATDMSVLVEYHGSDATLVHSSIEFPVDPVTGEGTQVDRSARYRISAATKGADLIEACRGRSPDNACYVRIRHDGSEVTELLSARAG